MNLHHLELFYHVARSGGITRALRNIPYGIQQPAVSIQMIALEEHLGTTLFERQPFRLTVEGRELFDLAQPFFERLGAFEARVQRGQAPLFRLAASELVLRDYVPAIMRELTAVRPDLRFRLRSGMQAEMERWLLEGEVDLAIVPLDARPRARLRTCPLVRLPLVLVVPQRSRVRMAADLWSAGVIREPLICLPGDEAITRQFQRGLRQLRVEWPIAIEASSTSLISQYVAGGCGLGVSVDLPGMATVRGTRVVPLPGFAPIEVVAMWCHPTDGLHRDVLALIRRHAAELFPGAAGRSVA